MNIDLFRPHDQMFEVVCPLWSFPATLNQGNDARFSSLFHAMMSADKRAEADRWREQLDGLIKFEHVQVAPFDRAHFQFLNGCLHLQYHRFKDAIDAFTDGLHNLEISEQGDDASRLQILLKLVPAELSVHYDRIASNDLHNILDIAKKNDQIAFAQGNLAMLHCHVYTQISQAFLNRGFFKEALQNIMLAIALINDWFHETCHQDFLLRNNESDEDFRFLSLEELPPQVFAANDTIANGWLRLYNIVVWGYSNILLWSSALRNGENLNQLHTMVEWLHTEITTNVDEIDHPKTYAQLPPGLRHAYRQSAMMALFVVEAILVLCEYFPPPYDGLLEIAKDLLNISNLVDETTHGSEQYESLHELRKYFSFALAFWQIEQEAVSLGFSRAEALPESQSIAVEALLANVIDDTPFYLETPFSQYLRGRYSLLVARLLQRLNRTVEALQALRKAETFFKGLGTEGQLLRLAEIDMLRARFLRKAEGFDDEALN